MIKFICFDNYEWLKTQPSNSFDSCVTDAPYGLGEEPNPMLVMQDWCWKGYYEVEGGGFMGKKWDAFVPQPAFWKEVYRVLKPGAHVLCFFGTRTYDWGVMAMRFAGFEIRDCLQWIYGSGFPKGNDISKAIDKIYGAEREVVGKRFDGIDSDSGSGIYQMNDGKSNLTKEYDETAPSTTAAKQWDGWNTALKPAHEPIVMARKPIEQSTVAENVLRYGTGAINVGECRIGNRERTEYGLSSSKRSNGNVYGEDNTSADFDSNKGRWPANVILTHHPECEEIDEAYRCHPDCPVRMLDEQSGNLKSGDVKLSHNKGNDNGDLFNYGIYGNRKAIQFERQGDSGGASRFFYCAKASTAERNFGLEQMKKVHPSEITGRKIGSAGALNSGYAGMTETVRVRANTHPTVKPIALMRWLVRLITPKGGHCIDPFGGSGTTGIACKLEGMDCTLIDNDKESCEIAEARIKAYFFQDKLFDL